MKAKLIALTVLTIVAFTSQAQTKYFTKKGKIVFRSETNMETIEATNDRVTSMLEVESGKLEFAAAITAFEFEKALMQEHFNEDYMESKKFPKASFKGTITDMNTVDLKKDGTYPVTVKGDLTMHGVTKNITEKGTITVKGGKISAAANIDVKCKDYNIKAPSKVAEVIQVKINIASYEPFKK
ncbi:MAG TPA: YceI family protein [Flavobacteriales bacterium]|nr:YceI family protein [Flavobacteriales bacterium]